MSLPSDQTEKVAIVTGSSTGIGYATSLALARNGFHTYATVRNLGKAKAIEDVAKEEGLPIELMELDVDSDESVNNAIGKIHEKKKRIDVAVNNAGYALVGPLEDLSMEEIRAQFETNLFGALRVMKAVLPTMRENRSGTIVNITSMGGRVAIPLDPAYHGSKFGLEGISESMRYETEPFGIRVIAIEPGNIKSNFWTNLKIGNKASSPDSPYASMIGGHRRQQRRWHKIPSPQTRWLRLYWQRLHRRNLCHDIRLAKMLQKPFKQANRCLTWISRTSWDSDSLVNDDCIEKGRGDWRDYIKEAKRFLATKVIC